MEMSDFGLDEKTILEIEDISVLEITWQGGLSHLEKDGEPGKGSLLDPRLESSFGHIVLACPVKPIEMVRLKIAVDEISILPVPPITTRMSADSDITNEQGQDDLTYSLSKIYSLNISLRNIKYALDTKGDTDGTLGKVVEDLEFLLEFNISAYLDNQLGKYWRSQYGKVRKFAPGIYQYCFPDDSTRTWNDSYRTSRVKELENRFKRLNL